MLLLAALILFPKFRWTADEIWHLIMGEMLLEAAVIGFLA